VSALFYLSAESPGAKIISNRPQLTPLIHPFSPSDTTLCAPDAAAAAAATEFWSDIRGSTSLEAKTIKIPGAFLSLLSAIFNLGRLPWCH
jgi:hypothetical protein